MPPPSMVALLSSTSDVIERRAHAAVLDAAAVRAGLVAAQGGVRDQHLVEVVDADAAALFGGGVVLDGRSLDLDRAALGVDAAAAGHVVVALEDRAARRAERREVAGPERLGIAAVVALDERVADHDRARGVAVDAAALAVRLVVRDGQAGRVERQLALGGEAAAAVAGEVARDVDVGERHLRFAVEHHAAAARLDDVPRVRRQRLRERQGVVAGDLRVGDRDAAAQADRVRVAVAVDAAAAVRLVRGDDRVVDRQRAAGGVDRAAVGLARVAAELRALDGQDAVARVRHAGAVVRGVVVLDLRVDDVDRADDVELGLVVDRRLAGLVHARRRDQVGAVERVERIVDEQRVGDHLARVVRDVAVARSGRCPSRRC